jgi:hypothetical protein
LDFGSNKLKIAHAQASRKPITDGTRKALGVSSPCLLACLCSDDCATEALYKKHFAKPFSKLLLLT